MAIIIALVVWLITCVFITGGNVTAAWLLFFAGIVGLIIYGVSKAKNDQSNSKQKDYSNYNKVDTQNVHQAKMPSEATSSKPIISSSTSTPVKQSKIQLRLREYRSLFANCSTVDEIVKKYIEHNDVDTLLKPSEIGMLKHYLEFNSKFKNQVWTRDDLLNRVKAASIVQSTNPVIIPEPKTTASTAPTKNGVFAIYSTEDSMSSQYQKEIITPKSYPYSLFAEMRNTAERTYGFILNEDTFIAQANFMKTFEDDYTGDVPFHEYSPTYSDMNDNQLRTYFTWRTKVRKGEITKTSLSYVFVYIYELINNIGISSPEEGIAKLSFILTNYSAIEIKVENYLVEWIKDYYICNNFTATFKDIVEKYRLEKYYPTVFIDSPKKEYSFQTLCNISKYKFEDSKFMTDENKRNIEKSFNQIIINLNSLFTLYGTSFDEIISGSCEMHSWWSPFNNAIYKKVSIDNKVVRISKSEWYEHTYNSWKAYKPSGRGANISIVLGYILKRSEAMLRRLSHYKYKLSPDINTLLKDMHSPYGASSSTRVAISDPLFDRIIDETTEQVYLLNNNGDDNAAIVETISKLKSATNQQPYLTFLQMRTDDSTQCESNLEKRFYAEAKVLEGLTDNCSDTTSLAEYTRLYSDMTNDQLRHYISWRTKIRLGEFPEIDSGYIRLYIEELVNNTGKKPANDVIKQLSDLLKQYGNSSRSLKNMLVSCIKDYFICNDFSQAFYEIISMLGISSYYPIVSIEFAESFDTQLYQQIANYKIESSKFYSEQNALMIHECFRYVFYSVETYFAGEGLDLKQLIIGDGYEKGWWRPFGNIHYYNSRKTDKRVVISKNEVYAYKNREWSCEKKPMIVNVAPAMLGYMFKRMEVKMREVLKFKYKLSVDISSFEKKINNSRISAVVTNDAFDAAIDSGVERYFAENVPKVFEDNSMVYEKPTEVKIDRSKLDKIREDSEIIRDKLAIVQNLDPTQDDLLLDISSVAELLSKKTVTKEEYIANGKYSMSVVLRSFGSWSEVILQAGLENTRSEPVKNIPEEEFISDLVRVSKLLEKNAVTRDEYTRHGKYSTSSVAKRVGSWALAIEKAGLKDLNTIPVMDVPEEDYIADILNVASQIGQQEVFEEDYRQYGEYSISAIRKRFGSWDIAAKRAGVFIDKNLLDIKRPHFAEHPSMRELPTDKVEIDRSKLDKIRMDADTVREKLTIEYESLMNEDAVFIDAPNTDDRITEESPMEAFFAMLSDVQINALSIIISNDNNMSQIIELSQTHKIMPEILLESINEISLDTINDNVIDTGADDPFIYDEYIDALQELVKGV